MSAHLSSGMHHHFFRRLLLPGAAAALTVAALSIAGVSRLSAQAVEVTERLTIAPQVGVALPAGQFSDYFDAGPSAGLRLAYALRPGLSLFAIGAYDRYSGAELPQKVVRAPDAKAIRALGGVEADLTADAGIPWSFTLQTGVGVTSYSTDTFRPFVLGQDVKWEDTGFTVGAGLQVGYHLTRVLTLFGSGQFLWARVDKKETEKLEALGPAYVGAFANAMSLPLEIGLRARI